MAYSGIVRRCLISCPGDVPLDDLSVVHKAINRWNGIYGPTFATSVTPISWGSHAAAEFGQPPQEILNQQLVDSCDMCIALFATRLGTPTTNAESGTAEEIQRLGEAGKYVAILRSRRPVTPGYDLNQAQRLGEYLNGLRGTALVLEYVDDTDLSSHVDNILAVATSRDEARSELQLAITGASASGTLARYAEVWPRVESEENPTYRGRLGQTARHWYLVLSNTGDGAARNVSFVLEPFREDEDPWIVDREAQEGEPDIEVLAPRGELRFPILATAGSATQIRCIVTWTDERGEQSNAATLRLN